MGNICKLVVFNSGKRENNPILNQIYDILIELHNQGKQLTLCKIPIHKENEETDKEAKQAINIPGMITT